MEEQILNYFNPVIGLALGSILGAIFALLWIVLPKIGDLFSKLWHRLNNFVFNSYRTH